jgi:hypothetical protein
VLNARNYETDLAQNLNPNRSTNRSRGILLSGLTRLNVLKRDGSVQPFDKNKLVNSISKAGATPQQASLVTNRILTRLGERQTVPSRQLSTMVARSLGQVNPSASGQYAGFRDQRLVSAQTAAPFPTSVLTRLVTPIQLPRLSPGSRYGKIVVWLKANYGSRFTQGASTDEIRMQLTKIFNEDIAPRRHALQGFRNYIAQRQYGDLVR